MQRADNQTGLEELRNRLLEGQSNPLLTGLEEDTFLSTREFKLLLAALYLKRGMETEATNLLRTSGPITASLHIAFLETALKTLAVNTTKALTTEATKQLAGVTAEDLNRAVAVADSFGKKSSYETAVQPLLQLKNSLAPSDRPSSLPSLIAPEAYWQTEAGFNTYLQAISGSDGSIYQQAYKSYVEILYALADGRNTTRDGQSITYHAVLEALAYLTQFAGSVSTETDVNMLLDRVSTLNLRIYSLVGRTDDNYGYPNKGDWLGLGRNFDVLERAFRDQGQHRSLIQEAQRAPVIALPVPLLDVESGETTPIGELWATHDALNLKSRVITTPIDETNLAIRDAETPIHRIVTRVFAALPDDRLQSPVFVLEHPATNWDQAVLLHRQTARMIEQTVRSLMDMETMRPAIQKLFLGGLEEAPSDEEWLSRVGLPAEFEGDSLRKMASEGHSGAKILSGFLQSQYAQPLLEVMELHQFGDAASTQKDWESTWRYYSFARPKWWDVERHLKSPNVRDAMEAIDPDPQGFDWVVRVLKDAYKRADQGALYAYTFGGHRSKFWRLNSPRDATLVAGLEEQSVLVEKAIATDQLGQFIPQTDGTSVAVVEVDLESRIPHLYLHKGLTRPTLPDGIQLEELSDNLETTVADWLERMSPTSADLIVLNNQLDGVQETPGLWLPDVSPRPAAVRMSPSTSSELFAGDSLRATNNLRAMAALSLSTRDVPNMDVNSITFVELHGKTYAVITSA